MNNLKIKTVKCVNIIKNLNKMKNPIKILICTLSIIIFGSVLNAEEKKNIVHGSLNGKVIELKEGKVVDAKLSKDVEYYVLYHSASW